MQVGKLLNHGRILALVFILLGGGCLYYSYIDEILIVDGALEPMDYPRALLFIWIFLSTLLLLVSTGKKRFDASLLKRSLPRIAQTVIGTVIFIALLDVAGFICSAIPYIFSFFHIHGHGEYRKNLAISVFSAVVFWLIFEKVLVMNLPLGFWENVLY